MGIVVSHSLRSVLVTNSLVLPEIRYSGVSGNFYPWMHVWLCAHWNKDTEKAIKVQRFLTVAEALVKTMYPASAKVYLAQSYSDFEIQPTCRVRDFTFLPEDRQKLRELQVCF